MELELSTPNKICLYKTKRDALAIITNWRSYGIGKKCYEGYIILNNYDGTPYLIERSWDHNGVWLDNYGVSDFNIINKCDSIEPFTAKIIYDVLYDEFVELSYRKQLLDAYSKNPFFDAQTGIILSFIGEESNANPDLESNVVSDKEANKKGEDLKIEKEFASFNKALLIPFLYTLVAVLVLPILLDFTFKYALAMHLYAPNDDVTTFWYYVVLIFAAVIDVAYIVLGGFSITVMALYVFVKLSRTKVVKKLKKDIDEQ